MHEWHTLTNSNILSLIDHFIGYEFNTDYSGRDSVREVRISNTIFKDGYAARDYITRSSYGGNVAYLAAYSSKKISKAYQNAFDNFMLKRKEYTEFKKNLTIGYGRKSSKVTCPHCQSSISLNYGKYYKTCPVCNSKDIISDSNWKILETKKKLMEKAATTLSNEAVKNEVSFMCGIEWHC